MPEQTYYESKPNRKIVIIWLLLYFLYFLLICGFIFIGSPFAAAYLLGSTLGSLLGLFVLIVIIIVIPLYLNFLYKTYSYKITDKGVYFEGGIIVKEDKFVPFSKITDIRTSQNIIEQIFGVKKLGFQTAGQTTSIFGYLKPEIKFEGLEEIERPKQLVYQLIGKTKKTSKYDE